jgi:UDP-glucose:(heptosyl)LPS alpha-1,3-glucosyltransferase
LNIALIILHADPARGGAERYTADLAAALAKRGHEVSLLAADFGPAIPGVSQIPITHRGLTRIGRYRCFLNALDQHLADHRYDIVHAMLPVRQCDVYHPHAGLAAEAAKQTGWRMLFAPRRWAMARTERQLLKSNRPPAVLCLSDYVKAAIRRHYLLQENTLLTLFNAVDLVKFEPAGTRDVRRRFGLPDDAVIALMIAQDFARKGLREAILALARIADARLRLLVVGKQDPAAYAEMARKAGVNDRVVFASVTDRPADFYRAADCFVLPTRHDPCSLVVLEALAMGVPVISTVFNGACEIMTDGVHGFVLRDPTDIDALAAAMRQMLDSDRRATMRAACVALRDRLSFDAHVERLCNVYQTQISTSIANSEGVQS